jgi:localization factor PodJL
MSGQPARDVGAIAEAAAESERQAQRHASRTAVALDSVASWIEQAEERINEASRAANDRDDRLAAILSGTLGAIKDRLDAADRRAEEESRRRSEGGQKNPESGIFPAAPLVDALSSLQRDMAKVTFRLENTREDTWTPVVNRIRDDIERLRETVATLATRDEVSALEQTVRQIGGALERPRPSQETVVLVGSIASLQRQVTHLTEEMTEGFAQRILSEMDGLRHQLEIVAAGGVERSVVGALEAELAAIRETLAGMAEPQRIERLAEEVATLARHVAEIRINQIGRTEFAGLQDTLEDIRSHLRMTREAQEHDPIPAELRGLSERVEQVLSRSGPDRLDPIRHQLTAMAERLDTLASKTDADGLSGQLAGLSAQIEARRQSGDLDRISDRLETMSRDLSVLAERTGGSPDLSDILERVSGQVAAMSGRLDTPSKDLVDRLDRLEESIRGVGQEASTASLEVMLRSLGEKIEQGVAPSVSLDGLEAQIAALTVRLEQVGAAPVHQALSETLAHVTSLRDDGAAIAERAARADLKEIQSGPHPAATLETEALKQAIAELKALQAQAGRKTQHTLKAVHNALETLVMRFPQQGPLLSRPQDHASGAASAAPGDVYPSVRLEAAVRKLHKIAISNAEELASAAPEDGPEDARAVPDTDEVLLEPGAPRPPVPAPATSFTASVDDDPGHVRANFIAAARRAVQGAPEPHKPAETGLPGNGEDDLTDPSVSHKTLLERIRQSFDTHRRPLLLSLALLVLTAGAYQLVIGGRPATDDGAAPSASIEAPALPAETPPADLAEGAVPPAPAGGQDRTGDAGESSPLAPSATGSLLQPMPMAPRPLASGAFVAAPKHVADVAQVGELPAGLPGSLRDAALAGDPGAVYEVATRLVDGAGIPRDPALAVRLYEKAAEAGIIPAQARLGNLYEKGIGAPRDLNRARSWYERASIGGNTRAMHNLAVLFAEGIDGKPDFASAQRWFQDAAEAGLRDSQFNLGVIMARGLGTSPDLSQSYKWFALAAAQGDEEAAKKRDEVASRLSPEDLAAAKALVESWQPRRTDPAANDIPVTAVSQAGATEPRPKS